MRLSFHGGAGEVGRSCITIDDTYMLDCGLKISEEGCEYPTMPDLEKIRAVLISHAHLDHTGALPLFNHHGLRGSIFCNSMTKETSRLLLKDSLHVEMIENQTPGYSKENIYNVLDSMQLTRFDAPIDLQGIKFTFLYAGHIPGSASILVEYNGNRLIYSGDVNYQDTHLMKGAKLKTQADTFIVETTYGDREHPERNAEEERFISKVNETLDRGGRVLIPAFAVGRSQEVAMMLGNHDFHVPVFMDGMAKKVSNLYLRRSDYVGDHDALRKAMKKITYVKNFRARKDACRTNGIYVTTSGMLDGGPVLDYLASMAHDEKSSVLLTGYQAEDTNGRMLMNHGKVYIDGTRTKIRCELDKYDFSAHSGRQQLITMINDVNPKHLILQHGDESSIESIKKEFEGRCTVHTPKIGDSIEIRGDKSEISS